MVRSSLSFVLLSSPIRGKLGILGAQKVQIGHWRQDFYRVVQIGTNCVDLS